MKTNKLLLASLIAGLLGTPLIANAYDGDWKRGHVYYRMVCTSCHVEKAGGSIGPSGRTKAEWASYVQADKHAKGKDSLKFYVSKSYRDSISATNKAAAKFADVPEQELLEDIKAFVLRSAKDGDAPTGCR
jgi:cytochrome c5